MTQKASKNRWRLLLFIGIPVLLIVIALVVALLGVNTFLKPTIKRAISKVITDGSDSLYVFSLKDYVIGPGGRSAIITGIDIHA